MSERPTTTCIGCGEIPFISLGEAFCGVAKCTTCKRMIELTHDERWDTFDYIDDKIDGLFTVTPPIDDDEI